MTEFPRAEPAGDVLSGTLSLGAEVRDVGTIDPEARSRVWSRNADTFARCFMVLIISVIFIGLNWEVMRLVRSAFEQDLMMIQKFPQSFKASDRVITANVFISLIGATVVQVGVATVAIVSYLFPKKPSDTDASK